MTTQDRSRVRRSQLREVAWILAGCVVLGIVVGVVWGAVAPRTQLTVREGQLFYATASEDAVGGVLTLGCLLFGCAVLTAGYVLLRKLRISGVLFVGIAAAGFIGSILAWKIGLIMANGADGGVEPSAQGRAEGITFSAPLEMDAPGVLGIWSLVAVAVLAFVVWRRARRVNRRIHHIVDQAHAVPAPTP